MWRGGLFHCERVAVCPGCGVARRALAPHSVGISAQSELRHGPGQTTPGEGEETKGDGEAKGAKERPKTTVYQNPMEFVES